ncbi:hypothetical protein IAT40_000706 [Kwoniella sp. CBS 6097]
MRPISPESSVLSSSSPLQSPRSSISSSLRSGMPLTPVYELDNAPSEMSVNREGSPKSGIDEGMKNLSVNLAVSNANGSGRLSLHSLKVPMPSFGNYSFPSSASPGSSSASGSSPGIEVGDGRGSSPITPGDGISDEDVALPQAGFTFGTCPSTSFLGTPTAEQGPFEYPEPTSSSSSLSISPPLLSGSPTLSRRPSLALGMTHRRGSIVSHPHLHSQITSPVMPVMPSPPSTRRSSTCSTIVTLPIAGRRPSILHSATLETSVPQAQQTDLSGSGSPLDEIAPLPVSGPSSRRGSTLMFPHKPLHAPIPPSLLARRGSLPAAQLFGLPLTEQPNRLRASYSAGSHTTTTANLYHRRQSIASESGLSTGSGATVIDRGGSGNGNAEEYQIRRDSFMRHSTTTPTSEFNSNTFPSTRRGSISFFPPVPSTITTNNNNNSASFSSNNNPSHPHQTPVRSSSISSRSSIASTSSGRSSSISSSRVPINFSPRHPNFHHTHHSTTTMSSVSRQNSLSRGTASSPSSPRMGSTSSSFSSTSSSSFARRSRHSSSNGGLLGHSNSGLSSSEESNEDEEEAEEELPTPSQSTLSVGVGAGACTIGIREPQSLLQGPEEGLVSPAPTFVDPWSKTTSNAGSITANGQEDDIIGASVVKGSYVPLETPPLETVLERPPLESADSGATERA